MATRERRSRPTDANGSFGDALFTTSDKSSEVAEINCKKRSRDHGLGITSRINRLAGCGALAEQSEGLTTNKAGQQIDWPTLELLAAELSCWVVVEFGVTEDSISRVAVDPPETAK